MLKIGLTGGIGSGKTYIGECFKSLGVPVFTSDIAARELEHEPDVQKIFKEILGEDIFVNGKLDRVRMRSIVFNDESILKKINTAIIPFIKKDFEEWYERVKEVAPYCIFESAIIYETGSEKYFDKIITVSADMYTRMKRTMKRDNISEGMVNDKFRVQTSDLHKEARADFIIKNDGIQDVIKDVKNIHEKILVMTNQAKIVKEYPEIGGTYKHYKGGKYEVITLAKHSETDETVVVYKSLHFGSVHVRPLSMWFDKVGTDKTGMPIVRFKLITAPKWR